MSKSFNLDPPLRVYRITLAAGERRPVTHGQAAAFHLPIQGSVIAANQLRVGFGTHNDDMPVSEGIFISAPGDEGWNETVFRNLGGAPLTFEYVLAFDPRVLIIHGV